MVLSLCLTLLATTAEAAPQPRGRGWLTGAGAIGVGAGLVIGVVGLLPYLDALAWNQRASAYGNTVATAATTEEKPTADRVDASASASLAKANAQVGVLIGGGVLTLAGIAALIIDSVLANSPVAVAIAPTPTGGAFVLSGTW